MILLKMFAAKGHAYAAEVLQKDGVELLLGSGVTEVGPGHVTLTDGSTILTRCVIWGGGLKAAPVAAAAGLPQGKGGRIDVKPDFTVAGFPGVLVIGDIANIPAKDGATHPQLGSVALQSGGAAAKTILADIKGETPKPFSYRDKGTMAMIGRGAAVAQVKGIELHGKLAFTAWLGVHAALMTGGSNRVNAFKSWAIDYFGKNRAPEALDRSGTPRMQWEDDDAVATAATAGGMRDEPRAERLRRHHHRQRRRRRDARRAPRPVGQADPPPRTGRLAAARDRELGRRRGVRQEPLRVRRHLVRRQGQGVPARASTTTSAAQTKFYGAALYRLRREDFGELHHHDGISPAWPITYDELEPYYTKAEQLYEVHGARGEDPTEPSASAPYPFPAVTHEPRIQQLSDDLARAGYHPFHAPCGVRLLESDMPNSPCIRCATCDGFPSLVQAKSDAEIFGVRPALEAPERHPADERHASPS